jgi:hypothetical protein
MSYESPEVTAHNLKTIRGWNMKRVMNAANPPKPVNPEAGLADSTLVGPETVYDQVKDGSYASEFGNLGEPDAA